MAFDTLSPRLLHVADKSLAHCKKNYGGNGLKLDTQIADEIAWRPTFFLKPSKFLIVAVEVADILYPEALKSAAVDVGHYPMPIALMQAVPLDVYMADKDQKKTKELIKHGIGILTVDEHGAVLLQHPTIPLAQHLSGDDLERELAGLLNNAKVKLRGAHTVYRTNANQGLQQAGQIVEAIIDSIVQSAVKDKTLAPGITKAVTADKIDALYDSASFKSHRAALGGARDFVKAFRNASSHAPKTAREAMEKLKRCRRGFLDAIDVVRNLLAVAQDKQYTVKIHII